MNLQTSEPSQAPACRFEACVAWHASWSPGAIGPGRRTAGLAKHIRKETVEIEARPDDLDEWVDVILLAIDGYCRHGGAPAALLSRIEDKQRRLALRSWKPVPEDEACEHDRSQDHPEEDYAAARLRLAQAQADMAEAQVRTMGAGDLAATLQADPDSAAAVLAEVVEELARQQAKGYGPEHDDGETRGQLATAGAHYAAAAGVAAWLQVPNFTGKPIITMPRSWPWEVKVWKPGPVRRMLVKAIALLVCEATRQARAARRLAQP